MTYLEIDEALVSITRQLCAACKERLDAIPRENASERKAVQLEYGMYTFCGNAGLLHQGNREAPLKTRQRFLENKLHKYPKLNDVYQNLDEEEKLCFLAALQAEIFLRDQWLGEQYAELSAAETSGDTEKIFELKIKIDSVETMFAAWEAWRVENIIYPKMF